MAISVRRATAVALMVGSGLLCGGLAGTAEAAGNVSVQGGQLVVSGGSEANAFFVEGRGNGVFAVDDVSGSAISAGPNCSKVGPTSVSCFGVTQFISVSAGDGNDVVRLRSTNLSSVISGGRGNDVLIGSSTAFDLIKGGDGDDNLSGSASDVLFGGNGFDRCSGVLAANKSSCEV